VTGKNLILIAAAGTVVMVGGPAWAHDPGLSRCLAMADKEARLSCYDGIARAEQNAAAQGASGQGTPGQGATVPAPPPRSEAAAAATTIPAPAAAAAAPTPDPRAEFGFGAAEREERRAVNQRQIDEVVVRVKEAREVGAGYWQFVMDDGTIWRLAETRSSYRMPRPNDEVKLLRASLGSYLLVFRNQQSLRIRRIE
jgi:hypothetical protein